MRDVKIVDDRQISEQLEFYNRSLCPPNMCSTLSEQDSSTQAQSLPMRARFGWLQTKLEPTSLDPAFWGVCAGAYTSQLPVWRSGTKVAVVRGKVKATEMSSDLMPGYNSVSRDCIRLQWVFLLVVTFGMRGSCEG
jgi:hypothetical protein